MRPDELDLPISFLADALDTLEDLPKASLTQELNQHLGSLKVRLQALVNSAELFQKRVSGASTVCKVNKARAMVMPIEELDPGL